MITMNFNENKANGSTTIEIEAIDEPTTSLSDVLEWVGDAIQTLNWFGSDYSMACAEEEEEDTRLTILTTVPFVKAKLFMETDII